MQLVQSAGVRRLECDEDGIGGGRRPEILLKQLQVVVQNDARADETQ